MEQIGINAILQLITVGLLIYGGTRPVATNADIRDLHDRLDKQDTKFEARFDKQDAKTDDLRRELEERRQPL